MFRRRILLASLLKPVNDTRMYAKLGQSLTKLGAVDMHIAGFDAPLPEPSTISFHPIFRFKRISWQRLTAQWRFWKLLKKLKPEVVIVCTHELLTMAWWYKKKHGGKLVYDVQENYQLNLQTQQVYGSFLGHLLGSVIRAVETRASKSIDHFLLAEASYASELPFLGNRYTVIENKFKALEPATNSFRDIPVNLKDEKPVQLLYSGTISELYGVLEAISFAKQFHKVVPCSTLTIIGYAPEEAFLQKVKAIIKELAFVRIIGGSALVPHTQILEQERKSHIALMPYRPHPSTMNCVPTKLYEYLANGLVVIAQTNPLWQGILEDARAGISLDYKNPLSENQIEEIVKDTYYPLGLPKNVFWEQEEKKLLSVMEGILQAY
ncbi:glycosyltransferase [Nibribacter koreensis]|uniref:Uncharacterized protein n=1 Tax=Nibribacter koreensis TaxID=1084519 RepID=A0ABP8F864_9BACT